LIGKDEYERMVTALKQLESESIMHDIQQGLNDIQQGKTQPIA
jgi:PHD/YefM family antitoxin component YafN of YafNO toxin-antitoxin module